MPQKLGKLAPRNDPRTLKLANYLLPPAALPQAPIAENWTVIPKADFFVPWPMFLNDELGDCVPAASGHMIGTWTANAGKPFMPADGAILTAYEHIGGYVPGDQSTDNGCVMLDALNYWRKKGIAGHKILAYVSVDPLNPVQIKDAVWLFGGAYIGVQLPISARGKDIWEVPPGGPYGQNAPGTWGGHCIPIVQYDSSGLTVVTWGSLLKMSWEFLKAYVDEAYGVLSMDWIASNWEAPNQFYLQKLKADLAKL